MNFENISIGTDIEETERFKNKTLENDEKFLSRIFTQKELKYCFSKNTPHLNLCGRYCVKEAVVKALSSFNITDVYYKDIEISNLDNGKPICRINKYPNIKIKVSFSHCKSYASANVICFLET